MQKTPHHADGAGSDLAETVTVIIPVFNGARFLAGALNNVLACGYPSLEIIVVDDGSTDGTAQVAAGFGERVRLLQQRNAGPAAARNRGIQAARTRLVTFLDVDDRWPAERVQEHAGYLAAHPEMALVQGRIQRLQHVPSAATLQEEAEPAEWRASLDPYYFVNLGSATFWRATFERVGLFNEALRFNEDTDWFFRAWELRTPKALLPQVALFYRLHAWNMTHAYADSGDSVARLFALHLARQRAHRGKSSGTTGTIRELAAYIGWDSLAAAERASQKVSS